MTVRASIRPAQPPDIGQVVRLCRDHAAFEAAQFTSDGKADVLRAALFAPVPRLRCIVAEADHSIIGYATFTTDFSTWKAAEYVYMDCLFVDADYRAAGLGTQMMSTIARNAGILGCATVEWQTPAWNSNAARFYERLGARSSNKLRFSWTPNRSDF